MLFLGLAPNAVATPFVPLFVRNDKVLHFSMFFALTLALLPAVAWLFTLFQYGPENRAAYAPLDVNDPELSQRVLHIRTVAAIATCLCFASEVLQALLTARVFDIDDIVANIGGAALAVVVASMVVLVLHSFRSSEWKIRDVSRLVLRPEQWSHLRDSSHNV
ncbi:hypothetical protein HDU98_003812 [Podochytrium sp. JEL0797]|nr:hypothetical protein HDU98_003812 [Podochytrium sp. JEL0797]